MTVPSAKDIELREEAFLPHTPQAHHHAVLIAIQTARAQGREEGRQEQRQETARNTERLVRSTCADVIDKAREEGRQEERALQLGIVTVLWGADLITIQAAMQAGDFRIKPAPTAVEFTRAAFTAWLDKKLPRVKGES